MSNISQAHFIQLYEGNLVPLRVCLTGLTWVLHDYFVTLEDEMHYIWPHRWSPSNIMFFWIRYYTIVLLIFDVVQIHVFSIPGITSNNLCVAMDPITRIAGALSLWSVELIMQFRVYALFKCSKRIAIINGILFLGSIAGFLWILIHNTERRRILIADVVELPLPGCPTINSGVEWAQWVPATAYEGVLFGFALYKTLKSTKGILKSGNRVSLYSLLLRDNLFYFFAIACLLVFNNLMVVGLTHIPWFSYGPFHASVGILTIRMMLNIRKASANEINTGFSQGPHDQKAHGEAEVETWRIAGPPLSTFPPSGGTTIYMGGPEKGSHRHGDTPKKSDV